MTQTVLNCLDQSRLSQKSTLFCLGQNTVRRQSVTVDQTVTQKVIESDGQIFPLSPRVTLPSLGAGLMHIWNTDIGILRLKIVVLVIGDWVLNVECLNRG